MHHLPVNRYVQEVYTEKADYDARVQNLHLSFLLHLVTRRCCGFPALFLLDLQCFLRHLLLHGFYLLDRFLGTLARLLQCLLLRDCSNQADSLTPLLDPMIQRYCVPVCGVALDLYAL